ncbi:coproporphyrinogen dehydrogenase HemZ [Effusibacillus dendaii]|uniref:Oxygen-independent coproporphyrinogen-III oxidase-like protein HemZ n=1 Tax=Effusibacillus dendaii TaxID=2743772 RepID=A0A7I8D887_9BACL|nr:coproporphyrinogen dehydrogenase HemZ [Effusibacillus dendaii]BCJ86358.1 oxygen-independent coproporphyrinogen-III oxidase-like protein HemZ [Effusibacillus dendaii]
MRIFVNQIGFDFQVEVERMTYLFFEEDIVTFEPYGDPDLEIRIRLFDGQEQIAAEAELSEKGTVRSTGSSGQLAVADMEQAARRKKCKQTVLQALHDCLADYTGEGQPWGILTGVRPMKLVHGMVQSGMPQQEIVCVLQDHYRIAPDRIRLLFDILDAQQDALPDLYQIADQASLYIGIPFCPTHCAYCTFPAYSMEDKYTYAADFLRALEKEFAAVGRFLREYRIPVTSVYLGGGTPTSLNPPELEFLMEMLYREIPGGEAWAKRGREAGRNGMAKSGIWREFTVEAGRPDTITPERVEVLRRFFVNRISVNPQTYKAETLKTIGRGHTPDIVDRRFRLVKEAGFENINMDMILGLPGEDLDDVRYTRERIGALQPDSVTVHTMSFKRTAVVNKEKDRFTIPHTQLVRMMMAETDRWARDLGYRPYYVYRQKNILGNLENTGYAMPGKEGIYNISIMEERQCIIGLGGGASTKLIGPDGRSFGRLGNPREPKAYVETIDTVLEKKIDQLKRMNEMILQQQL